MIIRPMRIEDSAGIARVHVTTWQTTYQGIVPDDYLNSLSIEKREQHWIHNLSTTPADVSGYVAENESNGEIAGFIRGGKTRNPELPYRGELYAIYILQNYQRRGLGRLLIEALVKDLIKVGISDMLLWVLEANHASRRFYEALGGQHVKDNIFEINGIAIMECAYAWTNLTSFLQEKHS